MDFLIHHLLRNSAERFPEKESLVHGRHRFRYAEVWANVRCIAANLRRAGIGRGDRAGILLSPSASQAFAIFGISHAGGVFVPIHHELHTNQVIHIVNDCGMKALITDAAKLKSLSAVLQNCPSLEFIVVVGSVEGRQSDLPLHSWDEWIRNTATPPSLLDVAIDKDLGAILYTSGSTGRPKGVMLSHANVLAGASIVSDYLHINENDRILAVLPFTFDAGLNQIMTAFQQHATCVLLNFLFAQDVFRALESERITGLAGVPTFWSLLSHSSALRRNRFPQLRYITNTGGTMPQQVLARLREALPTTDIYLMYGLTEAFRSTYLPPDQLDHRPTSIGRAIPNTEILVVNHQGERCKAGEVGELVHHGPTVALGYWGDQELTNHVYRPHPFLPEGWRDRERVVYSGDLVQMDDEGYLYFVGRRDNLIKSSGFRVSPSEVEEALRACGDIQDAAVIGVPDELLGQWIKAFVVPSPDTVIDPNQLLERAARRMPGHMVPKEVEFVSELPKTSSGKVDYPALKQRQLQHNAPALSCQQ